MPPVTQTLLIANVAVFLLQSASGGVLEEWFALWPPGHGFAIWQLVTYGFLHGGIAHIFFNMLGLYMFGSDIERLFGSRYFLAYYFACLVAAALTQLVFTSIAGGPPVPTLCASGGLYGLLLAFGDRKSTRLNSSHQIISYAVFCLKKKKITRSYANNTSYSMPKSS